MMHMMKVYAKSFFKKEEGQGMVEYALIIALIAIVVIGALVILGPQIAKIFTDITDGLKNTNTAPANQ
ncbi:MAG: Flp family type IVb pilin [Clostridia bacterium]|nr:Flp family type IVb pilin [Clostridia bacterium]